MASAIAALTWACLNASAGAVRAAAPGGAEPIWRAVVLAVAGGGSAQVIGIDVAEFDLGVDGRGAAAAGPREAGIVADRGAPLVGRVGTDLIVRATRGTPLTTTAAVASAVEALTPGAWCAIPLFRFALALFLAPTRTAFLLGDCIVRPDRPNRRPGPEAGQYSRQPSPGEGGEQKASHAIETLGVHGTGLSRHEASMSEALPHNKQQPAICQDHRL